MAYNLLHKLRANTSHLMELETGEKMTKVISIEDLRKKKEIESKQKHFKLYLSKLKTNELQYEANFIINRIKDEDQGIDFYLKGALLMDELALRIEQEGMATTIRNFSKKLKDKLREKEVLLH